MKNKEIFKLLKSAQKDEKIEDIPKETIGFKDVTIEYVMENVKNYKEFCKVTGLRYWHESEFIDFINPKKLCAQERLNQIESFFNKDLELDFLDKRILKYYPSFQIVEDKFKYNSYITDTVNLYGHCVYFSCTEHTVFVGDTFLDIYKDFYNIK